MPEPAPDGATTLAPASAAPQILLGIDFGLRRIGLAVGDTIVLGTARGIPEGTPARVQAAAERSTAAR